MTDLKYPNVSQPLFIRFRESLPNEKELVFGDELSVDFMFLGSKAVVHTVDTATTFDAGIFVDSDSETYGRTVKEILLAFVQTWCAVCTGYPNKHRTD